jgi:WLM domain
LTNVCNKGGEDRLGVDNVDDVAAADRKQDSSGGNHHNNDSKDGNDGVKTDKGKKEEVVVVAVTSPNEEGKAVRTSYGSGDGDKNEEFDGDSSDHYDDDDDSEEDVESNEEEEKAGIAFGAGKEAKSRAGANVIAKKQLQIIDRPTRQFRVLLSSISRKFRRFIQLLHKKWNKIKSSFWTKDLKSQRRLHSRANSGIWYQCLKGEPNQKKAEEIFFRLQQDFAPIIQRRGYKVEMVGEFNDDRDACVEAMPDHPSIAKVVARSREEEDTEVHGYNFQRIALVHETKVNRKTIVKIDPSLSSPCIIGLRLRIPPAADNVMFQFYSYSEICHTMCHELAHCVYNDHSKAFYKLMWELEEELKQEQKRQQMSLRRHGKTGPSMNNNQTRRRFTRRKKGRRLGEYSHNNEQKGPFFRGYPFGAFD